jgi:hypothetical protein
MTNDLQATDLKNELLVLTNMTFEIEDLADPGVELSWSSSSCSTSSCCSCSTSGLCSCS